MLNVLRVEDLIEECTPEIAVFLGRRFSRWIITSIPKCVLPKVASICHHL